MDMLLYVHMVADMQMYMCMDMHWYMHMYMCILLHRHACAQVCCFFVAPASKPEV